MRVVGYDDRCNNVIDKIQCSKVISENQWCTGVGVGVADAYNDGVAVGVGHNVPSRCGSTTHECS